MGIANPVIAKVAPFMLAGAMTPVGTCITHCGAVAPVASVCVQYTPDAPFICHVRPVAPVAPVDEIAPFEPVAPVAPVDEIEPVAPVSRLDDGKMGVTSSGNTVITINKGPQ